MNLSLVRHACHIQLYTLYTHTLKFSVLCKIMTYTTPAGEQILQAIEQWGYLPACFAWLCSHTQYTSVYAAMIVWAIIIMFDCALPLFHKKKKRPENRKWRHCFGDNTTETKWKWWVMPKVMNPKLIGCVFNCEEKITQSKIMKKNCPISISEDSVWKPPFSDRLNK